MTRPRRHSRFRDRLPVVVGAAFVIAAGVASRPRTAAAQACCVGTGLVTPARLRTFEDRAVGMQMRARSVMGAFGPTGGFAMSGAGNREIGFEEDCSARSASGGASRSDCRRRSSRPRARHPDSRASEAGWATSPPMCASKPWTRERTVTGRAWRSSQGSRFRPGRRWTKAAPTSPLHGRHRDGTATKGTSGSRWKRLSARASCRSRVGCRNAAHAPLRASSSRSRRACPVYWQEATRSDTTGPSAHSHRSCGEAMAGMSTV